MKLHDDDVAIVGMACMFAGAADAPSFWENILAGRSFITDHPLPDAKRVLDPKSSDFDRIYTTRGGYLRDLSVFDPLEYGVMPDTIVGTDPDHFLALKVADEALGDAGVKQDDPVRQRTDVILGHGTYVSPGFINWVQHGFTLDQTVDLVREMNPDYTDADAAALREVLKKSIPPLSAQTIPTLIPNVISGRVANRLDLMGCNYIIDAACASSLIAVSHAITNLLLDRCDLALAGGVQACILPQALMVFSQLKALSRQPALTPFDRRADGTMFGEGVGILALKRRKDAERDGNKIYALIKGVGMASDGRSMGLLAPRLEGEALAIQRAYEQTGVNPDGIELVEAHGTGIPLGDATEIHALKKVFGDRGGKKKACAVGSVKSMIGHCIPAAGAASIIKTSLALHHKIIPPTGNFEAPHPNLGLDQSPFYISTEARPWIHGKKGEPRRAGVSAMGFGGINTHCILEEYVG